MASRLPLSCNARDAATLAGQILHGQLADLRGQDSPEALELVAIYEQGAACVERLVAEDTKARAAQKARG